MTPSNPSTSDSSRGSQQLHELALFIHGVLAGLHFLGVVYNLRKRNWLDSAIHTSVAAYDIVALTRHLRSLHEGEDCRS